MATIKKAQSGTAMRAGEMTGKKYKASELADREKKFASELSKVKASQVPKKKAGGKVPKTPAQKKFAALAPPKNKITFADKLAGAKKKKK
jgi:hypothetical protein